MDTPFGSFLCPPGYAGPTGLRAIVREGCVSETVRYFARGARDRVHRNDVPYASRAPEHSLEPVVLVPGLLAGDQSLVPMSRHLRRLGYRTYRSMMWANVGCSREASAALEARIETITERRGSKVTIVGHSLGGLIARGLAGRRPDLVDGIITLGSPILAPGATHPLLVFDLMVLNRLRRVGLPWLMGEDCISGECARASWEANRAALRPEVAFTSVFSRRDGVVDWRSCLDPAATPVQVSASHLGMAFDPQVLDVVTAALATHRAGRERAAQQVSQQVSQPARLAAVPDASVGWLPAASR